MGCTTSSSEPRKVKHTLARTLNQPIEAKGSLEDMKNQVHIIEQGLKEVQTAELNKIHRQFTESMARACVNLKTNLDMLKTYCDTPSTAHLETLAEVKRPS